MNNRTYAGELAHNLSARVRATIVKRAAELDVKLINAKSKLKSEEKKQEWSIIYNNLINNFLKIAKYYIINLTKENNNYTTKLDSILFIWL